MVDVQNLSKRFEGGILAVDGINLQVRKGEVLGFLGPNGAGKSTTMKMITGFLAPTGGRAIVCGQDVADAPIAVKQRIGYLPEGAPAYPDMTPEAFLHFIAQVRGLSGSAKRGRIDEVVERVQIGGVMRQPIDTLSKGFKRRVGLAQAILHDPDVLILDEPTDGLDPNQKHEVRQLITRMAASGGKAIILSTHILEEVEAVCSRAVIIARGKLVADGTPHQLQQMSRYHNAVSIALRPPDGVMVFDEIKKLQWVLDVEDRGTLRLGPGGVEGVLVRCTVIPRGGKSILNDLNALAKGRGWNIEEIRVENGRLDDVFRTITGKAAG
ncbi:MAG: ABC transporter ATP-binding protein [Planctomycetota bacterium]|nr:ABC transporter ATP-binding protein [Planctomycetota bacterium]